MLLRFVWCSLVHFSLGNTHLHMFTKWLVTIKCLLKWQSSTLHFIIPSSSLHWLDSYGIQSTLLICKNTWSLINLKSELQYTHNNLIMRMPNDKESRVQLHYAALESEQVNTESLGSICSLLSVLYIYTKSPVS